MTKIEKNWKAIQLSRSNSVEATSYLPLLSSNGIPAIQIAGFLASDELDLVIKNMARHHIDWYKGKEKEQGRIGISTTGYSYDEGGMQKYFDLVPLASKTRDEIFAGIQSPIDRIIELFSVGYIASVATESKMNDAQYFAGLIRAMGAKSTLHFDFAPNQLSGWSVADSDEQFGLVLHLQTANKGGELTIYNRPWVPADEEHNMDIGQKGKFGFKSDFLKDTPHTKVTPSAGDLIVFKSRNFHQVEAINTKEPRLTLTTFMSQKNKSLLLWS